MDDDPRFMPLAGGKSLATASTNSSPSVRWTIRIISKHTPEGRNFFHNHYRPFRLRMLKSAPYGRFPIRSHKLPSYHPLL
jgi:hypothetical protein